MTGKVQKVIFIDVFLFVDLRLIWQIKNFGNKVDIEKVEDQKQKKLLLWYYFHLEFLNKRKISTLTYFKGKCFFVRFNHFLFTILKSLLKYYIHFCLQCSLSIVNNYQYNLESRLLI